MFLRSRTIQNGGQPKHPVRSLVLVIAIALLGATCPHHIPTGTWTYPQTGVHRVISSVMKGNIVLVDENLGDRMFTSTLTAYDLQNQLHLRSVKQSQSCCGMSRSVTVNTNVDSTYNVQTQYFFNTGTADRAAKRRPHLAYRGDGPLLVGSIAPIPWLFVVKHSVAFSLLTFFPVAITQYRIEYAASRPSLDGLPDSDQGITIRTSTNRDSTTLWFNPCTYVIDAYQSGDGGVLVREAHDVRKK